MARPASFDVAPRKQPKNKQRAGKEFEPRVKRGLESLGGWTARFTDTVNVGPDGRMKRTAGAITPPDFIHINKAFDLLIECKAQRYQEETGGPGSKSFAFDRVEDHQLRDLAAFNAVSRKRHFGCIAILWWNGKQGKGRIYRAWLIPVTEFLQEAVTCGRKSVPFGKFDWGEWSRFEMQWRPGKTNYFNPEHVIQTIMEES